MSAADDAYGDLLNRLGWTDAEQGPGLLWVLDEIVGERLSEAWGQMANAVRALHSPRSFSGDGYGWEVCAECRQTWPCATEQALQAVEG